MRRWILLSVLIGLTLTPPLAAQGAAQDPIEADRPDFTEGTGIVPLGHWQAEGGFTYSRVEHEETSTLGELLVRIPFTARMEARLGIGSYDWSHGPGSRTQGYEDPYVGMKVRLSGNQPSGSDPEIALLFLTTVPVGARGLTADVWQPTAKLALGWDLAPRFSLSSNLNLSYLADGGERFTQVAASVSAGYSLSDRLGAFLEAFGFSKETAGGSATAYLDSGLSYTVTDNLRLDIRAGAGLNGPSPDYFVGAGTAVRW
jgi:hypothetical protein